MQPVLLGNWSTSTTTRKWDSVTKQYTYTEPSVEASLDEVASDFGIERQELDLYDVLLASYETGNYEGWAYVVLRGKCTGKLYEVEGSHCSCYGLEGNFSPEESDIATLERHVDNHYNAGGYSKELCALINQLSEEQNNA